MTKSHFAPCPSCARHVRVTESACPFCCSTLAAAFRASRAPRSPSLRLSRAALVALGAGTVGIALACSDSRHPPYGQPPPFNPDADIPYDAAAPPPRDSGIGPTDGGTSPTDATSEDTAALDSPQGG